VPGPITGLGPRIIATASLFALLAVPSMAHADECLCFTHSSGAELNRCQHKGEYLLCVDSQGKKSATLVSQISSDWKRVKCEDVEDVCEPPREVVPRGMLPVPRGDKPKPGDEKKPSDETKPGQ
jgi:hypothetical protein